MELSKCYEILALSPSASLQEIRTSFRQRSLTFHPDKGGTKEQFEELHEAYTVLMKLHGGNENATRTESRHEEDEMIRAWKRVHTMFHSSGGAASSSQFERIEVEVTLEELLTGTQKKVGMDELEVLAGMWDGQQLPVIFGSDGQVTYCVKQVPHPTFARVGNDLLMHHAISAADAGLEFTVTGLDGTVLSIQPEHSLRSGEIIEVAQQGMFVFLKPHIRGMLKVIIRVDGEQEEIKEVVIKEDVQEIKECSDVEMPLQIKDHMEVVDQVKLSDYDVWNEDEDVGWERRLMAKEHRGMQA